MRRKGRRGARPTGDRTGTPWVASDVVVLAVAALALVLLPLVASREVLDTYDLPKQSVATILACIAVAALFCRPLEGRPIGAMSATPAGIAVLCLILGSTLSLARCINLELGLWELGRLVVFLGLAGAVTQAVSTPRQALGLVGIGSAVGLVVSVIGLAQVMGRNFDVYPQVAPPAASFGNKNMASEYLVTVLPLPLVAILLGSAPWAVVGLAAGSTMTAFLYLAWTRTDWAAALFVMTLMTGLALIHRPPKAIARRLPLLAGVLAVAVLSGLVPRMLKQTELAPQALTPSIGSTVAATFTPSAAGGSVWWRITAWVNTMRMILESPIIGHGINNWQLRYPRYHRAVYVDPAFDTRTQATTLHNDYLQVWAEGGVLAFVGFVGLIGMTLLTCARIARAPPSPWTIPGLAAGLGVLAFGVDALGSFPFKLACPTAHFMIFLGIALRSALETGERVPHASLVDAKGAVAQTPLAAPAALRLGSLIRRVEALMPAPRLPGRAFVALSLATALLATPTMVGRALDDLWSNAHVKRSYDLAARGRWCDSAREYVDAIQYQRYVYSQFLLLGRSLYNCGHPRLASLANEMAARFHPNHCNIYYNWGNCLRELGDMTGAEKLFATSVALYPDNADAHNNRGIVQKELGRNEAALESFRAAARARPRFFDAMVNEGVILAAIGRIEEAKSVYQRIIDQDPRNARAWARMGDLLGAQKRLPEAEAHYAKALEIDPGYLEVLNNLGGLLWNRGDATRAQAHFERAIQLNPQFGAPYFGLGDMFFKQKKFEDSIRSYRSFLTLWPRHDDDYVRIARARLKEMGQPP